MKTILLLTLALGVFFATPARADFSEDYAFYVADVMRETAAENRYYRERANARLFDYHHETQEHHPRHHRPIVIVVPPRHPHR